MCSAFVIYVILLLHKTSLFQKDMKKEVLNEYTVIVQAEREGGLKMCLAS
jgi:hypothetical protein